MLAEDDADTVVACVDLVERCGARNFELGCLREDVPVAEAGWWAHAQYQGARLVVDDQPSPAAAADALAQKLLTGARCRCGRLVALSDHGGIAYRAPGLSDGTTWTFAEAAAAGQCRWRRAGRRWEPSCPAPDRKPNRAERRRRP